MGVGVVEVEICEIPSLHIENSLETALGDIDGEPRGVAGVAALEDRLAVSAARRCHRDILPAALSLSTCSFRSALRSRALALCFRCPLLPCLVCRGPWICPFSTYSRISILKRELGYGGEERAAYSEY